MPMIAAILGALCRGGVPNRVFGRIQQDLPAKRLKTTENELPTVHTLVLFLNSNGKSQGTICLDTRYMVIV
jgi:hypothetical protein